MKKYNLIREIMGKLPDDKIRTYKVCIFCMGEFGLKLYFKLKEESISIDYFGDNDCNKRGYALDNIYCYSMQELEEKKDDLIIIVAKKNPHDLVEIFNKKGFAKIITYIEIEDILENIEKQPINLQNEYVKALDYSQEDYLCLFSRFKRSLFEILQGEENTYKQEGSNYKNHSVESYLENILENASKYYSYTEMMVSDENS